MLKFRACKFNKSKLNAEQAVDTKLLESNRLSLNVSSHISGCRVNLFDIFSCRSASLSPNLKLPYTKSVSTQHQQNRETFLPLALPLKRQHQALNHLKPKRDLCLLARSLKCRRINFYLICTMQAARRGERRGDCMCAFPFVLAIFVRRTWVDNGRKIEFTGQEKGDSLSFPSFQL